MWGSTPLSRTHFSEALVPLSLLLECVVCGGGWIVLQHGDSQVDGHSDMTPASGFVNEGLRKGRMASASTYVWEKTGLLDLALMKDSSAGGGKKIKGNPDLVYKPTVTLLLLLLFTFDLTKC